MIGSPLMTTAHPARLKVAMVSDVYFPRINGVSTSIETFRAKLQAHGVDVTLVAPRYGNEGDQADIIRVPSSRVPRDPEDRLASWGAMHRAAREAALTADLVHVQTPFVAHYAGLSAARRAGLPIVGTYHTLFEEYLHHYVPFLPAGMLRGCARMLSRSQCNAYDGLVVPSGAMRDRLADYGVRSPMTVLPTGIPTERFGSGDGLRFRSLIGIDPDTPMLLFVGRVAHEKNIDFLLRAMQVLRRRNPRTVLVITGEGPALQSLRESAQTLGLQDAVRFVGYLDRSTALADAYAAATAFVFASRTETQGLVLLEAMAAGTPVVALSVMGTADILGAGQGCLTPPDDTDAFADALAGLLDNPEQRRLLSGQARTYAAQWSDDALAQRLANLYRSIVTRGSGWKVPSREKPA